MNAKSFVMGLGIMTTVCFVSCKTTDQDIKVAIEEKLNSVPYMRNVSVGVHEGVAIIAGICNDSACMANCENLARRSKGVRSVVSRLSMAKKPVLASIIYRPDDSLALAVSKEVKKYKTIEAEVKNGVITLNGQIRKRELRRLMKKLNALNPVNISNNLAVR
jgi:hyperosmotically inducible periplasmic protein